MSQFMSILQKNRITYKLGEQANWNYALKYNKTINVTYLSIKLFPCGDEFYVKGKRLFYYDLFSILYLYKYRLFLHNSTQ